MAFYDFLLRLDATIPDVSLKNGSIAADVMGC
jgi:hypothetical protein